MRTPPRTRSRTEISQPYCKCTKIWRMDFTSLKKMGVVLKRAHYFITCGGKQMYHTPLEETYITRQLVSVDRKESWEMAHANEGFSQMTLAVLELDSYI